MQNCALVAFAALLLATVHAAPTASQCKALKAVSEQHASSRLAVLQRRASLSASIPPYSALWAAVLHWCAGAPLPILFYSVLAAASAGALAFAVISQLALPAGALYALAVTDDKTYNDVASMCKKMGVLIPDVVSPSKLVADATRRAWFSTALAAIATAALCVAVIVLLTNRVRSWRRCPRGGSSSDIGGPSEMPAIAAPVKLSFETVRTRLDELYGGAGSHDDSCVICLVDIKDQGALALACTHPFHTACMAQWLTKAHSPRCPVCRLHIDGLEPKE